MTLIEILEEPATKIIGAYAIDHLIVTGIRAYARHREYKHLSDYPRQENILKRMLSCSKKRIWQGKTFAYSGALFLAESCLYLAF